MGAPCCAAEPPPAPGSVVEHLRRAHLARFPAGFSARADLLAAVVRDRSLPGATLECCVAVAAGLDCPPPTWSCAVFAMATGMALEMLNTHELAVEVQRGSLRRAFHRGVAETIAARIYICAKLLLQLGPAQTKRARRSSVAVSTRPIPFGGRRPRAPGLRRASARVSVDCLAEHIARDWKLQGVPTAGGEPRQTATIDKLLETRACHALLERMQTKGLLAGIYATMAAEAASPAEDACAASEVGCK